MFSEVASPPTPEKPPPEPPTPANTARDHEQSLPGAGVPWFWISGVLMFLGCFLLNAAAHERKDELLPVLGLVFVFNVYELAVLSLAAWLRRHGAEGESRRLAWLAVILLADTTFVYNTLAVVGPAIGGAVAALGLALAGLKLLIVVRISALRLRRGECFAVGAAVATVFLLPVAARIVGHSGFLGVGFVHAAAWWIAAVLALGLWAWDRALSDTGGSASQRQLRLAMLGVPLLSVVAHALALPWMYKVTGLSYVELFPLISPVLLGLSLAMLVRSAPGWSGRRAWAAAAGTAAVLTAESSRLALVPEAWPESMALTPVRCLLLVGAAGYAWLWWRQRSWGLVLAWPVLVGVALLGPTLESAWGRVASVLDGVGPAMRALVPKTRGQWGAVAIIAAFVVLALGGWSARRKLPQRASP
ncbi:MAG: hypothetical protein AAGF84_02855 [Planctomycetota bacterium]